MTDDLERRLRSELLEVASSTRVSPGAYEEIVRRAHTLPATAAAPARRWAAATSWAAIVVVVLAAVVLLGRSQDVGRQSVVAGQPASSPPVLDGYADVDTVAAPCNDCMQGWFRIRLGDARPSAQLLLAPSGGVYAFSDGRFISERFDGEALLSNVAGMEIQLGGRFISAGEGPDGTVIVITTDTEGPRRSRLSRHSPGSVTTDEVALPEDLVAHAAAVTAEGEVLVLADADDCCLNRPVLVTIGRNGREIHRVSLGDAIPRTPTFPDRLALSINVQGLAAISSAGLASHDSASAATVVVDAKSGRRLAFLEGWRGVAWSPDGRGILAARTAGQRTSDLAVFWGEGFEESLDAGSADFYAFPRRWSR